MADFPIGLAVRGVRMHRRLSQLQVAERMGCQRTYISKVERASHLPNLEQIVRLADAMGIEVWKLIRFGQKLRDEMETA
jgi:transcriptional regulator with XRE-family HTH domain